MPTVTEILSRLEVRPSDNIERDQVLLYFVGDGYNKWTEVFTAGNISTFIGKAKSRKTFFITLITAALIGDKIPGIRSQLGPNDEMVLFDTEQGKYYVYLLTKRINAMLGMWPERLKVFGLRPLTTIERLTQIQAYIEMNKPKVVFIDGVRDLVTDINDANQATDVVGKLMNWSYEYHCHICSVLHQNKADDNARGHIGTEIVNKSETVLSVKKDGQNSLVKSEFTRNMETKDLWFGVDTHGLPYVLDSVPVKNEQAPF